MIASMKRAFIVIREKEKRKALVSLRKLGLMHMEAVTGKGLEHEELVEQKNLVLEALGLLGEFKSNAIQDELGYGDAIDLAKEIKNMDTSIKATLDHAMVLSREIERIRPWGDFKPELIRELAQKGCPLRIVELPVKKMAAALSDRNYIKLSESKGMARLAIIADDSIELDPACIELSLPAKRLSELEAELSAARENTRQTKEKIKEKASFMNALEKVLKKLDRDIAFESFHSGMDSKDGLAWFAGWIPEKDVKHLSEMAEKAGWGLLLDNPLDEEQPPTKIENPALIRMIEPIFDFLGTVPNYREYDISGLFLLFFTFFFAMIFGDGGYGALLLLAGIFAALKAKKKDGRVPDPIRLLMLLGGATMTWGAVSMSWFGMPVDKVPAVLQKLSVYWLSNANPDSGDNVKVLCFVLGLVQLSIAHLKNIKRDFPAIKFVGQLGQLAMVDGMFFLVLNLVISSDKFPIPFWALYTVLGGFVLNFVFSNYEEGHGFFKGLVKSIISSFANIVSVFLGIVNIFADIVSYIRLWAVGLAGLAISQTVNNMAGPMFGKAIMFAMGAALLVFGHGLNIIMSVLSVVVHGVRLNVLEFSGHLGMEWSGYKYEPFKDTVVDERVKMERSL
ncbi:V-type ATP synthase subunit I [Spirochaetota bacterium]